MVSQVFLHWGELDKSALTATADFAKGALDPLPANATLVVRERPKQNEV